MKFLTNFPAAGGGGRVFFAPLPNENIGVSAGRFYLPLALLVRVVPLDSRLHKTKVHTLL